MPALKAKIIRKTTNAHPRIKTYLKNLEITFQATKIIVKIISTPRLIPKAHEDSPPMTFPKINSEILPNIQTSK
jgi:hypothetical protein